MLSRKLLYFHARQLSFSSTKLFRLSDSVASQCEGSLPLPRQLILQVPVEELKPIPSCKVKVDHVTLHPPMIRRGVIRWCSSAVTCISVWYLGVYPRCRSWMSIIKP